MLSLSSAPAEQTGTTLAGGRWIVRDGATLSFPANTPNLSVNQGEITLHGPTSTFAKINGLATNEGLFRLLDNRSFTANTAFTNAGTLVLGGGTFTAAQGLANNGSAALTGSGTIAGSVVSRGTIAPGTLQVTGNLTLGPTSLVAFDLAGATPGSGYGTLSVGGLLTRGGTLQLSLVDGFSPAQGMTFGLFNAADSTGTFASVALPELGGNLAWDDAALYTNGLLTVVPEPTTYAVLLGLGGLVLSAYVRRRRRG